jgi:signal transduction histidine kinase/CheY-like chemotaxis protein
MKLLKGLFLSGFFLTMTCLGLGLWSAFTLRQTLFTERQVRLLQDRYDHLYSKLLELDSAAFFAGLEMTEEKLSSLQESHLQLSQYLKETTEFALDIQAQTQTDDDFRKILTHRLSSYDAWLKQCTIQLEQGSKLCPVDEKMIARETSAELSLARSQMRAFQWQFVSELESRHSKASVYLIFAICTGGLIALGLIVGSAKVAVREIRNREAVAARLSVTQKLAEQAVVEKGRFVASVSHELRTPLNAILGLAEMLLSRSKGTGLEGQLTTIYRSGETLLRIVNDILDFSRFESESFKVEPGHFELRTVIADIHELLIPVAEQKGLTFQVQIDEGVPPFFFGDSGRLSQVLRNLVSNALNFTKTGQVQLKVELASELFDSESPSQEVTLRFHIVDTGIGIPEDKRAQLFTPFYQAHGTFINGGPSSNSTGTGLGLSISKTLVQKMGGDIIYTPLENGSCFTAKVCLWTSSEGAALATLAHPISPYIHEPQRIALLSAEEPVLVVDDNSANQILIEMQLQQLGLRCHMVSDGLAAVEAFRQNSYSAILMDCQMPEMDGFEATRRIRKMESENQVSISSDRIPIFALTANITASDRSKCHQSGMDAVLAKPLRLEALYHALAGIGLTATDKKIEVFELEKLKQTLGQSFKDLGPRLLSAFHASLTKSLVELESPKISSERILFWAHYLRGPSSSLGATSLSLISASVEEGLRGASATSRSQQEICEELLRGVRQTRAQVNNAIQRWESFEAGT